MIKRICPVCQTDEFVTYIMGTHAEGRPTIIEGKEKYIQGDYQAHENCECDKCGGEFSLHYEIHNSKIVCKLQEEKKKIRDEILRLSNEHEFLVQIGCKYFAKKKGVVKTFILWRDIL